MPSSKDQSKAQSKGPNQINDTGKKGKTLGAEHASHGDFGAQKSAQKAPQNKSK